MWNTREMIAQELINLDLDLSRYQWALIVDIKGQYWFEIIRHGAQRSFAVMIDLTIDDLSSRVKIRKMVQSCIDDLWTKIADHNFPNWGKGAEVLKWKG
jgi:hypothetical protein